MQLTAIMIELRGIILGGGLGIEEQCRKLAFRATHSIPDPLEALLLQEEMTLQLSMLSFNRGSGAELAPIWDELVDLVDRIGCASRLH